jgi:hypothetical protein
VKVFQILHGRCHWQTPFTSLDEVVGRFPPDCLFVEAPDYVNEQWGFDETEIGDDRFIKPVPPEGFIYDDETGTMYPESMVATILEETQNNKQAENNNGLSSFLDSHPLTWTDGKNYGVTKEDQEEITLNINAYDLAVEAGQENPVLQWHAVHEAATDWTREDLVALYLAICDYVNPWYTLNQTYKTQIYACETAKEVQNIEIVYMTDEEKAAEAERLAAEEAMFAGDNEEEETSEEESSEEETTEEESSEEQHDKETAEKEAPVEEVAEETSEETESNT